MRLSGLLLGVLAICLCAVHRVSRALVIKRGRPELFGWRNIDGCNEEAVGIVKQAGIAAVRTQFGSLASGATARLGQALMRALSGPSSLLIQNLLTQLHNGPVVLIHVAHIGATTGKDFQEHLALTSTPLDHEKLWTHVISTDSGPATRINVTKALGILSRIDSCRAHGSGRALLCWLSFPADSELRQLNMSASLRGLDKTRPWLDLVVREGQPGEVGVFGLTAPMRAIIAVFEHNRTSRSRIELLTSSPGSGLDSQAANSNHNDHTYPATTARDAGLTVLRTVMSRALSHHTVMRRSLSYRGGFQISGSRTMLHIDMSRPWMAADVEAVVAMLGSKRTSSGQPVQGITMLMRHAEQPDIATAIALLPPHWPRILLPTSTQTAAMLVIACNLPHHQSSSAKRHVQEQCGGSARALRLLRRLEFALWDSLALCTGGPHPETPNSTIMTTKQAHALASAAWFSRKGFEQSGASPLAAWSPSWNDWLCCSDSAINMTGAQSCPPLHPRLPLAVLMAQFLVRRAEDVWQQRYPHTGSIAPVHLNRSGPSEQVCMTPNSTYPPSSGMRLHGVLAKCVYHQFSIPDSRQQSSHDGTVTLTWPSFEKGDNCLPATNDSAQLCVSLGEDITCGPPCVSNRATWQHEPVHFAPLYQPMALQRGWSPGAMPSAVVADQTARLCGSGCVQSAYHLLFLQHFPDLLPSAGASQYGETGSATAAQSTLSQLEKTHLVRLMEQDRSAILTDTDAWWAHYVLRASPWTQLWRPNTTSELRKPWLASLMRSDKLFAPGHGVRSWLARVAMGLSQEVRVGARALADPKKHPSIEPGAWISRGVLHPNNTITVMGSGSGHMSMRDIDDGFAPFKAAFVIENQRMSGWWTEKLVSALLWQTIPIYYGSPTVAVSDSIIRVPWHRSRWFAATCGRSWTMGNPGDKFGQVCWPAHDNSGDWFVRLDARGIVVATTESALRRLATDPDALRQRLSTVPHGTVVHNWAFSRELRAQQVTRHMYAGMGGG